MEMKLNKYLILLGSAFKGVADGVMFFLWFTIALFIIKGQVDLDYDFRFFIYIGVIGTYLVSYYKALKDTGYDQE